MGETIEVTKEKNPIAQAMVALRWKKTTKKERQAIGKWVASHGAGRKRDPHAKRCPCGNMTLRCAKIKADKEGKGLGHEKGCTFYRPNPHFTRLPIVREQSPARRRK